VTVRRTVRIPARMVVRRRAIAQMEEARACGQCDQTSLLFLGSELPEATVRGVTLRGLRDLVRKIKELVKIGQFRKVTSTSTYPFVSLGEVITSYSELTTTDIVER